MSTPSAHRSGREAKCRSVFRVPLLAAMIATAGLLRLAMPAGADEAKGAPAGAVDPAAREAEVARQLREHQALVLVKRGRQSLASGAYAEARDAFQEALRLRPGDSAVAKLLADAEEQLGAARTMGEAKEHDALKARELAREADLNLFAAERALKAKDYAKAAQQAERVLALGRYIEDAARAAEVRTRAQKVLDEARLAGQAALAAHRQEELGKATADARALEASEARSKSAQIRALRDRGWKLLDAGKADEALAVADTMLRLDSESRDAIALQDQARQTRLTTDSLRGVPAERREATDKIMAEAMEETVVPDVSKVILPAKASERPPRVLDRPMEAWERDLRAKLDRDVTMEFDETPLDQAVQQIAAVAGLNIIVDPDITSKSVPVTISRATMPLGSMLRWVAHFGGLDYSLRHGAVFMTSPQGMMRDTTSRIYDITGLLTEPKDALPTPYRGPVETLRHASEGAEPEAADPDVVGKGWVDFIRTTIAPGTWGGEGDPRVLQQAQQHAINYRNGRIVIVHTPEVHRQVEELLDNFRKARNLQVHVMARFIELSKLLIDSLSLDVTAYSTEGLVPSERFWSGSGTLMQDPEVGALSRFSGFDNTGGLNAVWTYASSDTTLQMVLNALIKQKKGTVLSAPRLTCFNTQRANIQVLTNHNYVRRVSTDNEPEIGNVPEGIVFDVQPFVSADRRYITLVLQPQIRELVGDLAVFSFSTEPQTIDQGNVTLAIFQETYIQIPTTRLRSLGTTVTVPNGGTLLLGGFTEVEEHAGMSTVPFIDGIPLLRTIFRGWERNEGRRSLIMLVTAQTVPDLFEE